MRRFYYYLPPSLSFCISLSACKMSTGVENEQLPRHCTLHANQNNNLKNTKKKNRKNCIKIIRSQIAYACSRVRLSVLGENDHVRSCCCWYERCRRHCVHCALRIRAVCPQRMCRPRQNDPGILTKYFMHSFACR